MNPDYLYQIYSADPILSRLNPKVSTDPDTGYIILTVESKQEHLNHFGYYHGGLILALLDVALCLCVYGLNEHRYDLSIFELKTMTTDVCYKFLAPANSVDTLKAVVKTVTVDRDWYHLSCDIYSGSKLVGVGSGSVKYSPARPIKSKL